jgi:hypothetical protein
MTETLTSARSVADNGGLHDIESADFHSIGTQAPMTSGNYQRIRLVPQYDTTRKVPAPPM